MILLEFEDGSAALFVGGAIMTNAKLKRIHIGIPHPLPNRKGEAFLDLLVEDMEERP